MRNVMYDFVRKYVQFCTQVRTILCASTYNFVRKYVQFCTQVRTILYAVTYNFVRSYVQIFRNYAQFCS